MFPVADVEYIPAVTCCGLALMFAAIVGRILTPDPASAQSVEVPTFTAATPTFEERARAVDVTVGPDGSLVFLWVEMKSLSEYRTGKAVVRRFSSQGAPLGPARRVDTTGWVNFDIAPVIDADQRGGYVGGWNILTPLAGGGYAMELYGTFLDASATALGSDFEIGPEADEGGVDPASGDSALGLPSGAVFAWNQGAEVRAQLYDEAREPRGPRLQLASTATSFFTLDLDRTPDGGFVAAWMELGAPPISWGRVFDSDGQPRAPAFPVDTSTVKHLAANPRGGFAAMGTRFDAATQRDHVWIRRFTETGTLLGEDTIEAAATIGDGDLAYDQNGNLLAAWDEHTPSSSLPGRARAYDAYGTPLGPPFAIDPTASIAAPRVAPVAGGKFVTVWINLSTGTGQASVFSLCAPGAAVCGDGVHLSQCEQCDDGAANSDTLPDACRTDCRRARCGDGVLDAAEECDDGNTSDGDCCSRTCRVEPDFDFDGVCDPGDDCPLFPDPDQTGAQICNAVPLEGLGPADEELFVEGLEEFSEIETPETGLGPVFNGASCAECHHRPTIGGSSALFVTRFGRSEPGGDFDPMIDVGGPLLQAKGTTSAQCSTPGEVVPLEATIVVRRESPPLFGLGLVEGIPDDKILRLADPGDRNGDEISGRANLIGGRVGRFGWKAHVVTLRDFAAEAYLNEMGITSPAFASELAPQGGQVTCDAVPDPEDNGEDVTAFTNFVSLLASLPVERLTLEGRRGRVLFKRLRCQACHTERLRTGSTLPEPLRRKRVRAFSDLLLHDMGPGLADGIVQGDATASEFRTAPLWGVRESGPYLHDGRAATVDDAIAAHGGEAQAARDRFLALGAVERAQLIAYLNAL